MNEKDSKSVVAFVFSIVSIVMFLITILIQTPELGICVSAVGLGLAITAIVFGVKGKKIKYNKGMAIAGFVMGIIGTCFCSFSLLGCASILQENYTYDKQEENTYNVDYNEEESLKEVEKTSDSSLTIGQKNAVRSASDYLNSSSFSRQGLIHQLEYEKYSTEDATYAVDSLNVDWKEQAVKSASDYLNSSSFSRQGLIEQLQYEGFTYEEAVYGVEKNGY